MSDPGLFGHLAGICGPCIKVSVEMDNGYWTVNLMKRPKNRKDNRMISTKADRKRDQYVA